MTENIEDDIVIEVSKKNPEQVKEIKEMFEVYQMKASALQSYFRANAKERDKIAKDLQKFLMTIEKSYIEQWCMIEMSTNIINYLETEIQKLGGDVKVVRAEFSKQ